MDFNYFLSQINKLSSTVTEGLDSQFKMAPVERLKFSEQAIQELKPRKAAVLSLFYPNKMMETCFLLTLRANYKGIHGAQISFPGGKFEPEDITFENTALREAEEEIGIKAKEVKIFKEMTKTFIPPSNFLVIPFLGYQTFTPVFKMNHEVERLLEVKLSDLLDDRSLTVKNLSTSYMENIDVPCFKLNNCIVWGATAMMLSEIKDLFTSIKFLILIMFVSQFA
jgi:8-oxo-dGTP pyrophosphatase MutT (NUDIX family)